MRGFAKDGFTGRLIDSAENPSLLHFVSFAMEPLSAAASIMTVLQVTHKISILCLDIHHRINSAKSDIARISEEIRSLRSVLEGLAGLNLTGRDKTSLGTGKLDALASVDKVLTICTTELQDLELELQKVVKSSSQSRLKALSWMWKEQDVVRRLQNISRLKSTLQLALDLDQTKLISESHANLLSLRTAFDGASSERHRRSIIDWLGTPSSFSNFHDAQKLKSPSTGDWFLKSPRFKNWKEFSGPHLWLHGIPGSGKTVLCSSIVGAVISSATSSNQPVVLYHFFDFSTQDNRAVGLFLRSLLAQAQISEPKTLQPLKKLYDSYHSGLQYPNDKELLETLRVILMNGGHTYIIIDAMDECLERDGLLDAIEKIDSWKMDKLRILTTSRMEGDIQELFRRLDWDQCRTYRSRHLRST
jgi:hypothetical protein